MFLFNSFMKYFILRLIFVLLFVIYNGDTSLCENNPSIELESDEEFEARYAEWRRLYEIEVYGRERNYFERNADTIIGILLVFTLFCTIAGTYLDYIDDNNKK